MTATEELLQARVAALEAKVAKLEAAIQTLPHYPQRLTQEPYWPVRDAPGTIAEVSC